MLPGWDRLQDLRRGTAVEPIPVATVPKPAPPIEAQLVADPGVLEATADRIVAKRVMTDIAREERRRVSKLGAIADRIAAKKEAHDKKADEWAARLDALDQREPSAFEIGDSVIAERETDLSDMEATMRKVSNLPNVVSGKS